MIAENHLREMELAVNELHELSLKLSHPASLQYQYVGTCVDNTLALLVSAENSIDGGHRSVSFTEEQGWVSVVQAVHRSFYSTIVMVIEMGCKDFCAAQGIELKNGRLAQAETIIKEIEKEYKLSERMKKRIRSMGSGSPSFLDHIVAVSSARIASSHRRDMWFKYFVALNIVRNKNSHADTSLTDEEARKLREGGFSRLISSSGQIQANTRNYYQICNHVLDFFKEAGLDA